MAPADSLSQAQLEGGQGKGAQLEGGQLETVTVSATPSTARLTLRGMGSRTPYASNRVKAYFNDVPLTSGDGATIIEDLELSTLQSVEVLKGPASALYGPALGGVIVLRTSPPTYERRRGSPPLQPPQRKHPYPGL